MPQLLVNLPVFYIEDSGGDWLDLFIQKGIRPEIGLDANVLDDLPRRRHVEIARALRDAGLAPSVHLPFMDLLPGARDKRIRDATISRLKDALDVAAVYEPAHMVAHALYWQPFYANGFEDWLEGSTATWKAVSTHWRGQAPIYLENVFETDPEPLTRLMSALADPGIGLCLDLGHWHSFGGGARQNNLAHWIGVLAPWLRHLHLHDNHGEVDEHLGMGQGSIPWTELFSLFAKHALSPTFTLEPHTREAFDQSLAFMAANPEWFAMLEQ